MGGSASAMVLPAPRREYIVVEVPYYVPVLRDPMPDDFGVNLMTQAMDAAQKAFDKRCEMMEAVIARAATVAQSLQPELRMTSDTPHGLSAVAERRVEEVLAALNVPQAARGRAVQHAATAVPDQGRADLPSIANPEGMDAALPDLPHVLGNGDKSGDVQMPPNAHGVAGPQQAPETKHQKVPMVGTAQESAEAATSLAEAPQAQYIENMCVVPDAEQQREPLMQSSSSSGSISESSCCNGVQKSDSSQHDRVDAQSQHDVPWQDDTSHLAIYHPEVYRRGLELDEQSRLLTQKVKLMFPEHFANDSDSDSGS